ncbi:MAG: hypothetical protein LUG45_10885 [Clostridiales bacterium]|nr:hypothetical protein [Clostridiales bacterium]
MKEEANAAALGTVHGEISVSFGFWNSSTFSKSGGKNKCITIQFYVGKESESYES